MMNENVETKEKFEVISKRPLANRILTTSKKYDDSSSTVKKLDTIDYIQRVVAVGPMCREVKVNDIVEIDPSRYVRQGPARAWDGAVDLKKPMPTVDIPVTIMNGKRYLEISENDIKSVITEYSGEFSDD